MRESKKLNFKFKKKQFVPYTYMYTGDVRHRLAQMYIKNSNTSPRYF